MIDWPDMLVKDIARRRAILFLGSGVSKNSVSLVDGTKRPPTWEEFLRKALEICENPKRHVQSLLKGGDYLTACEILKHRLDEKWNEFVQDQFVVPKFQTADIHRDIFNLDCRLVLTQNVDRIYDAFASSESNGTVYVKDYSKVDIGQVVRGDKRCVLKAHGTVDTPDEMVFTRKEYLRARYQYGSFYALLDALAVTHTLLFIGCGTSDPDVQLMLERHANVFPGNRPHYMVTPKGLHHAEVSESLKRNLNLRFLVYKPQDYHKELQESIASLVSLVEEQRELLAESRDW